MIHDEPAGHMTVFNHGTQAISHKQTGFLLLGSNQHGIGDVDIADLRTVGFSEQAAGSILLVMKECGMAIQAGNRVPLTVEHPVKIPISAIMSSGADGVPDIRRRFRLPVGEIGGVVQRNVRRQDVVSVPVQVLLVLVLPVVILVGHLRQQSQLLGVRLRSEGKDYYAIRAEDGKFYDRNGTGLAKGFLRFPTAKQFRISSNFNPRRTNPVTGRVAPHRGVDFAMPQGTPVLSVGDGEVVVAKRSGAAGYYVAIRHGRSYTTRYMHLRKILVKPGQKVKRGDRIALSGNTGRSTGPHLHYEVWINQQAVNPLTAKLPRTEGLTGSDRREFLAQAKEIVPQLRFD